MEMFYTVNGDQYFEARSDIAVLDMSVVEDGIKFSVADEDNGATITLTSEQAIQVSVLLSALAYKKQLDENTKGK